ncbi:hypothetical protein ACLOJK_002842 [Asimina triloba]
MGVDKAVLVNETVGVVSELHAIVDGLLLVEGEEEEGDELVLGEVTNILVHGGVGRDGNEGLDSDAKGGGGEEVKA